MGESILNKKRDKVNINNPILIPFYLRKKYVSFRLDTGSSYYLVYTPDQRL